jgi:ABC-type multidrug transport system ATPase subunit
VLEIIRALAAQGVTILFTTHNSGMAAAIASFVVLMRQDNPF